MTEEQKRRAEEQRGEAMETNETATDQPETKPSGVREEKEQQEVEYEEVKAASPLKVVLITLGVILLLVASAAAVGGLYLYSQLQPVDPAAEDEVLEVEIPMGSSTARIAQILHEQGLIKNEKLFYFYVRYLGVSDFQAGQYQLSPSMSAGEIIKELQEGRLHRETLRFTIPEGLTVEETAQRLEEQGVVDADRFLQVVNNGDFSEFSFVQDIPEAEDRKYRLEGFLYPETYEVYKGTTEEDIVRLLLEQFEKVFKEEWHGALEEHGMTVYEAVTLASIIERETVVDEERKKISGVLHNRLEEGMLLQADATVLYALGEHKERVLYQDLEVDNPYNTYKYPGLPPGPIASPGLPSLEAAIFPAKHDYLFYVTKKDGSGTHYFSKTYAEHRQYDEKSRRHLDQAD
ncbi:UPF0755 protein [Caldalkalibacillus uzonensis]|uniref:Endolytic murein transglycosylase n=1 Tax=Caldalkalibacillus uzonensis TaxID=353224 RepID=A0ABU0CSZ6_9BACI|nr:endolytic transglycosylase MltG [Caldalkalibacillus uzonensis]MDQ0339553.1 UPF0755 protein [Caldalkalibacillus uzonensis]